MRKNNILLFLIVFLMGTLITISGLNIVHSLDSYCTMCNGYKETALWFLANGRVFSFIFYYIFGLIKLPYDYLKIVSILLSNIILSICVLIMYNSLKHKNKYYKLMLLLVIFLIYYSPLSPSILLLDESFIINLGILFLTLSSIYMLRDKKKDKIIAILFSILGVCCYQGLSAYLFITTFILLLNIDKCINIKDYIKKIIFLVFTYGISFVLNFIFIKIINVFLKINISKVGMFNIFDNIKLIITNFIPKVYKYFFGYINYKYYYLLIIILLIITIINIIKNNNKLFNIVNLIFLLLSCLYSSFIPNLFMSSNYIEARMVLSVGIIPVVIIIYNLLTFNINKREYIILIVFSLVILMFTGKSIYQNMNIDRHRYQADMKYINNVIITIEEYEEDNDVLIDKIYYARDRDVAYYYYFGFNNDVNIRLMAIDWAMECAISYKLDRKINFSNIATEDYNKYFKDKNYDEFNIEQLVFENDVLYLLVY